MPRPGKEMEIGNKSRKCSGDPAWLSLSDSALKNKSGRERIPKQEGEKGSQQRALLGSEQGKGVPVGILCGNPRDFVSGAGGQDRHRMDWEQP